MRKSLGDLAVMVSQDADIPEDEARETVERVLRAIKQVLSDGDVLTMQNFGRFDLRYRRPRQYREIGSGAARDVPGRHVVRFRPAKRFREAVE